MKNTGQKINIVSSFFLGGSKMKFNELSIKNKENLIAFLTLTKGLSMVLPEIHNLDVEHVSIAMRLSDKCLQIEDLLDEKLMYDRVAEHFDIDTKRFSLVCERFEKIFNLEWVIIMHPRFERG